MKQTLIERSMHAEIVIINIKIYWTLILVTIIYIYIYIYGHDHSTKKVYTNRFGSN